MGRLGNGGRAEEIWGVRWGRGVLVDRDVCCLVKRGGREVCGWREDGRFMRVILEIRYASLSQDYDLKHFKRIMTM